MELMINRMEAAISGAEITLSKEAGGQSNAHPGHLDCSEIVLTSVAAAAPAEFWRAAATGVRYTVIIRAET